MSRNVELFARASRSIPGGVNSPVRAFRSVGGTPRFVARAQGPYFWDADDKRYIDYIGSWGPAILGHSHPEVVRAVQEAAAEATALQRKLSQEADDKLLADLKSRGVQVTTVDKAAFAKATDKVDDKWLATPIGPYLKKVIAAAR